MTTIVDLWPSSANVQASLGVESVDFRTYGGALLNWSSCVLCVLCDTLFLRFMIFMFCVKEAIMPKLRIAWFSQLSTMIFRTYHAKCNV